MSRSCIKKQTCQTGKGVEMLEGLTKIISGIIGLAATYLFTEDPLRFIMCIILVAFILLGSCDIRIYMLRAQLRKFREEEEEETEKCG